jgi:repressor LexA
MGDMEPLGTQLRRQRRQLGLTLDELASRTGISKPYLSLIETGRVPNPPSDEKLRRLEATLAFKAGELVSQAHLQRTPSDVRMMLSKLLQKSTDAASPRADVAAESINRQTDDDPSLHAAARAAVHAAARAHTAAAGALDVTLNPIPIINRRSGGYPTGFSDLNYPRRVAQQYIACPDLHDPQAFAVYVTGDAMTPNYAAGDLAIFSPALTVRTGDDCFIRFADGTTDFARVFFETDEAGEAVLRLQPRNERHRPRIVGPAQATGLHRAVYRLQRIDET